MTAAPVVTPEGVVLELRTGGLPSRGVAKALDLLIAFSGAGVLSLVAELTAGGALAEILSSFTGILALFAYPAIMETLWRGRTVGKAAVGLRVVTEVGGPIAFRHALVRALLLPVEIVVGVEAMLVSPRDRRVGDVLAGTIVLVERPGGEDSRALWFAPPLGLEAYTASLDATGVTAAELALLRDYLNRWRELSETRRRDVAATLAGPLARRLGHVVPPGVPPEVYLICVVSARQERDDPAYAGLRRDPGWGDPAPGGHAVAWPG